MLLSSMLVIGAVVLTIIEKNGANEATASLTLRFTAWTSFLIFLLVFVTRPLRQLFKSQLSGKLLKNRRSFGIAFAGSHTVHLILIVWFFTSVSATGPSPQILVDGGGAYVLLYLMLVTSFDKPTVAIGHTAWRRLHKIGLYWLGAVFTVTFVPKFLAQPGNLIYLLATILIAFALGIRVVAFLRGRKTEGSNC